MATPPAEAVPVETVPDETVPVETVPEEDAQLPEDTVPEESSREDPDEAAWEVPAGPLGDLQVDPTGDPEYWWPIEHGSGPE